MTTEAVATRSKATEVKKFLEDRAPALSAVLPKVGLTPEALTRTALSQIYKNPQLLECDPTSLMRSIVEAASLGLSFALGRAYLVPFRNKVKLKGRDGVVRESYRLEAQLMPGYLGLADIARRSGEVSSINSQAVYKGDDFKYEFGLEKDVLEHRPLVEPNDAELTHVYCVVRFKDGGYQVVVLTRHQVEAVRKRSKSANNGPWVSDYAAMAKKTAVKQVLKLCPASIELVRAIDLDNRTADDNSASPIDFSTGEYVDNVVDEETGEGSPAPPPTTKTEKVADTLRNSKKKATDRPTEEEPAGNTSAAPNPADPKAMLEQIANIGRDVFTSKEDADIEVDRATGGRCLTVDRLTERGTPDDIAAVLSHFRDLQKERR